MEFMNTFTFAAAIYGFLAVCFVQWLVGSKRKDLRVLGGVMALTAAAHCILVCLDVLVYTDFPDLHPDDMRGFIIMSASALTVVASAWSRLRPDPQPLRRRQRSPE